MPRVKIDLQTAVGRSARVREVSRLFHVKPADARRVSWSADLPSTDGVGLIVGPSGSGKTTLLRSLFGDQATKRLTWSATAVVDDFDDRHGMERIASVCQAVGFNTIPAWLRPYKVLSNGEQFRVSMARRLVDAQESGQVVVDEFTSVVDRQVAKIGAHAVQRYARRNGLRFVASTCHYDVIPWLQPDWIYDTGKRHYSAKPAPSKRPSLDVAISPVPYKTWHLFSPFHYLTATLNPAARCYGLFVEGNIAAIAGLIFRPDTGHGRPIWGISRVVTLPDFQGLGLAFVLMDTVASWYKAMLRRVHMYPAHPSFVRAFDRSPKWALRKKPGTYYESAGRYRHDAKRNFTGIVGTQGGRPCAVFSYEGPAGDEEEARRVFRFWPTHLVDEVSDRCRKESPGKT